ncbi:MAG: hypothetical protein Kow0047_15010 [Anaerolineae bacterium]
MFANNGVEFSNEWLFLREQWQHCREELRDIEQQIVDAEESGRSAELPKARRDYLRRMQEIIDELHDETAHTSLERAIGARLRRLQNSQMALLQARGGRLSYSERYWDQEVDRQILNELLTRWQEWFKAADDDAWAH